MFRSDPKPAPHGDPLVCGLCGWPRADVGGMVWKPSFHALEEGRDEADRLADSVDAVLSHRDSMGRFDLWMPNRDWSWPPGLENEVDPVVNANVLAYMGDHPETRDARRWVETVVLEGREADASPYCVEPLDLHFAMARATRFRDGLFCELRPTLASRILERLDSGAGFNDPMRATQALSALDMLAFNLGRSAHASAVVETTAQGSTRQRKLAAASSQEGTARMGRLRGGQRGSPAGAAATRQRLRNDYHGVLHRGVGEAARLAIEREPKHEREAACPLSAGRAARIVHIRRTRLACRGRNRSACQVWVDSDGRAPPGTGDGVHVLFGERGPTAESPCGRSLRFPREPAR